METGEGIGNGSNSELRNWEHEKYKKVNGKCIGQEVNIYCVYRLINTYILPITRRKRDKRKYLLSINLYVNIKL